MQLAFLPPFYLDYAHHKLRSDKGVAKTEEAAGCSDDMSHLYHFPIAKKAKIRIRPAGERGTTAPNEHFTSSKGF